MQSKIFRIIKIICVIQKMRIFAGCIDNDFNN